MYVYVLAYAREYSIVLMPVYLQTVPMVDGKGG